MADQEKQDKPPVPMPQFPKMTDALAQIARLKHKYTGKDLFFDVVLKKRPDLKQDQEPLV